MGSITVRSFKKAIVIAGIVASSLLAHIFHLIAGRMLGPEVWRISGINGLIFNNGVTSRSISFLQLPNTRQDLILKMSFPKEPGICIQHLEKFTNIICK